MPENISGGGRKYQSFCSIWNKWEAQVGRDFEGAAAFGDTGVELLDGFEVFVGDRLVEHHQRYSAGCSCVENSQPQPKMKPEEIGFHEESSQAISNALSNRLLMNAVPPFLSPEVEFSLSMVTETRVVCWRLS